MKLSDLRIFLAKTGASPRKRLSQNFLIDSNITRKIVRVSKLEKDNLVVEIGPGPGALTQELVGQGHKVIAIEKDKIFAEHLREMKHVQVFEDDVLKFPLEEILKKELSRGKKAKVISNLPYHITTPILEKLLPLEKYLSSLTLMVQKEVGERLTAQAGSPHYSHLTLFTRFFSDPTYCFTVSPSCFYPAPKVESAVVHFVLKKPPLVEEKHSEFFRLTRFAFAQRRKMLRASLKRYAPSSDLLQAFEDAHISSQARGEELSLEEFLMLFHCIAMKKKDASSTK